MEVRRTLKNKFLFLLLKYNWSLEIRDAHCIERIDCQAATLPVLMLKIRVQYFETLKMG